jgi:rSAM/selenodomain-associated transferase 2
MNYGVKHATGDVLLFLHADCSLEPGALAAAGRCLQKRGIVAGCFRMRVQSPAPVFRTVDTAATARVRLTGLIYGDQGLFLRRDWFERVGGFPELPLMEDVFISVKLRKLGRVAVAPRRIYVSPRRWEKQGVLRQTLRNWTLTALAAAGVHPDRLAASYPAVR